VLRGRRWLIAYGGTDSAGCSGLAMATCISVRICYGVRLQEWSHWPVATAYGQKRPTPASLPTEGGGGGGDRMDEGWKAGGRRTTMTLSRLSIKLYRDYADGLAGVVCSSTWDTELRKIEQIQAAGISAS
jgi:hypothetical protein